MKRSEDAEWIKKLSEDTGIPIEKVTEWLRWIEELEGEVDGGKE